MSAYSYIITVAFPPSTIVVPYFLCFDVRYCSKIGVLLVVGEEMSVLIVIVVPLFVLKLSFN